MGGKAFVYSTDPYPLNIIRLSPSTYRALCARVESVLHEYFSQVFIPPEVPGKIDYGDVDVLIVNRVRKKDAVDDAGSTDKVMGKEELRRILGARRSAQGWSFALPVVEVEPGLEGSEGREEELFQLDVGLIKPGNWEWECMVRSYGDLWRIVGASATKFGLMINNSGFHVRIAEIEKTSRADSLLRLTNEPRWMMKFLDLEVREFAGGDCFESLEETFRWATRSKYFRRSGFLKNSGKEKEERPMYQAFVSDWLPAHPEVGVTTAFVSREHTLEMVLDEFDKREEYNQMLKKHQKKMRKEYLWKRIRDILPLEGKDLGEAMIALKKFLLWNNAELSLLDKRDQSLEKIPDLDADTVDSIVIPWVRENWQKAVVHARSCPFESRSTKN